MTAAGWLWLAAFSQVAAAQNVPPTPPPAGAASSHNLLRVFLDCNDCDIEYVRQNVEFVDYVRDRAVADLHVMVTTQQTGGGGNAWTVKFIGLGPRQGQDRTLTFDTLQTATPDDRRKAFVRILKIGVVGYAADTTGQTTATKDKWNFWVFRIETSGNVNGERSSKQQSYRLNFSGNRTTDRWKITLSTNGNYSTNRFIVDDNQTIKSLSHSWDVNALVVKSLTPRWSFGARASVNHSSFSNNDLSFTGAPGFEYDFFPYSESSRRSLTLQYTIGVSHFKYREVTVFDKLRETVPNHQILAMLALKQPWGSVQVQYAVAEHLNHADRYRASLFGQGEVRLFKGFSFNLFGAYDKINDQISLRKAAVSTDDVLLHVQQLATSYSYFVAFGISYSFGSIFNNVVNTRFGQ